ncbi:MAG: TetR family transcriptional regulator [Proteobacteria bacterium]|nr:TetR family transcriptional regulator [Pseudomonadota bacterium]
MAKESLANAAGQLPTPSSDGRRQRSDESRRRIVEAMLEFARDGQPQPSAEDVAERAGVGRRTVFRLFTDMETLYREMHAVMLLRIEDIKTIPIKGDTAAERLECILERRVRLYEEIMPIKTAADTLRQQSKFLQEAHENVVLLLRQMLQFLLPKEIKDDADKFEALDVALSLEVWRRLRQDQNLSVKNARRVWEKMIAAIIA